ncbi:hypothetical protein ACGH52_24810 [Streptomyces sp. BBFR25]|uniref:hypothetical protein n=1 Tax=Streptomyces sp. BBFR25 TaxID=3372855 RepID=UPI0037DD7535
MIEQRTRPAPVPTAAETPVALLLGSPSACDGPDATAAVSALLEAWACGLATHVVDQASRLAGRGPESTQLADTSSGLDVTRPAVCAAWAREQVDRGGHFDVVLGLRPEAQESAAVTAEALGLRGNRPDVVRRVQDPGACRAALAAEGFLVEATPEPVPGTLAAVGVFAAGRPHVVLVASVPPAGPVRTAELTRPAWAALADEASAAVRRLGLEFGVFRVDLRPTGRGHVLTSVRTTLGDDGVHALLGTAVPWLEPFGAVYDDALGRALPLPSPTRPRTMTPAAASPAAAPVLGLAGDPDDAREEPHLCRGID